MRRQEYIKVRHIYRFVDEYYSDWFPLLVSYQVFNNNLSRLGGAFNRFIEILL